MKKPLISALFTIFVLLLTTAASVAQGTAEDYKRALSLGEKYRDKVFNSPSQFNWIENSHLCWYINNAPNGDFYMLINADDASQAPAFDHNRMAAALQGVFDRDFDAGDLDLEDFGIDPESNEATFRIDSAQVKVDLNSYKADITEIVEENNRGWGNRGYWGSRSNELEGEGVASPDEKWVARIVDYNVMVENRESGEEFQLSYDGTAGEYYSSRMRWSPDSRMLMAYRMVPGEDSKIHFIESSPDDQLQPKLQTRDYLKPGDRVTQRYPQLFDIEKKVHLEVATTPILDQYSVNNFDWREDGRYFTFEYNQRGHQNYRVIKIDRQGNMTDIVDEKSKSFIDYSSKKYRYDLEESNEMIWASERDGWNHLYLYDTETGNIKNQITEGEWVVRDVIHVDEENREIIFEASGLDSDQDPYLIHTCKVGFNGKGFKRLTTEDGSHDAEFSDDYEFFIDRYSRIDMPPVVVLRSTKNGKVLAEIQQADITQLQQAGWQAPEVFTAKGRDGKTDIWGIIVRPSNFDPEKTYPVIEYIYAGPHSSFVPKTFRSYYWNHQQMAELGFIVVQIDGMGTSNRSKAFHDISWQNLKDGGFPDRKLWIKAAAEKYPFMDAENVGIYGTSAGGQNSAAALVFHSDFYDVAVSSCGCHDNRMDKIWWNEQFMGKIGPHYAASSNIVNAHQMGGKIMLIVGELDDNVDPATTMQFVNELVKANKDHELVVIPGARHTSGGEYGERKRKDFFVKNLLGVDPPSWSEVYDDNAN